MKNLVFIFIVIGIVLYSVKRKKPDESSTIAGANPNGGGYDPIKGDGNHNLIIDHPGNANKRPKVCIKRPSGKTVTPAGGPVDLDKQPQTDPSGASYTSFSGQERQAMGRHQSTLKIFQWS